MTNEIQALDGEDLVTDSRINELSQEHGLTAEGYWSEDAIAFGRDLLRIALAAKPNAPGTVTVPIEPTAAMVDAAIGHEMHGSYRTVRLIWAAMLANAPQTKEQP